MDLERTLAEIEEKYAHALSVPTSGPKRRLYKAMLDHAPLLLAALKAMAVRRRWMRLVDESHADANAAGWEYHKAGADFDALAEGE